MSRFRTPIHLETVIGATLKERPFIVLSDIVYITDELPTENVICVKTGFRTDFATIPRFLWRVVGAPSGWYREGAIIHDWLCPKTTASGVVAPFMCDHITASNIFYEAMIDIIDNSGWSAFKKAHRRRQATIMRWAVAKFGPQFEADSWGGGS